MPLNNPSAIEIAVPIYNSDKIIYTTSGVRTAVPAMPPGGTPTAYAIPHTVGRLFFPQMLVSLDQVTWYAAPSTPLIFVAFYAQYLPVIVDYIYADASNVHIGLGPYQVSDVYYKIVGFL